MKSKVWKLFNCSFNYAVLLPHPLPFVTPEQWLGENSFLHRCFPLNSTPPPKKITNSVCLLLWSSKKYKLKLSGSQELGAVSRELLTQAQSRILCCNGNLGAPLCAAVGFFESYLEVDMGITCEDKVVGLADKFSSWVLR